MIQTHTLISCCRIFYMYVYVRACVPGSVRACMQTSMHACLLLCMNVKHLGWLFMVPNHIGLGLSPPVKYFTDRSKAVLLLWIFYVFVLSCVCYVLCASVYMCFVVTCWERADLLALVCGVFCEFVTFPLVSWVRCGT